MPSGPKSMRSLYAGLRASGKGSASRTRPTRMSTRSKSETSMVVASPNMPSVVCPRYAAHAAGDASAVSDHEPLRVPRSRGHRTAGDAGALHDGGVPRPHDGGTFRARALGTPARPGARPGRGAAVRRPGIDRVYEEHDNGAWAGRGGPRLGGGRQHRWR